MQTGDKRAVKRYGLALYVVGAIVTGAVVLLVIGLVLSL